MAVPSTGNLALDLMCGSWGAADCTAKKWFDFMGTATGDVGYVPFQINYLFQNGTTPVNNFTPLDPKIVPCYEKYDV